MNYVVNLILMHDYLALKLLFLRERFITLDNNVLTKLMRPTWHQRLKPVEPVSVS